MQRWVGKVAVVTGASSGLGASIVEHLVEKGIKVVGLARRLERMESLAEKLQTKNGNFHGIQVDLRKTEEIVAAFQKIEKEYGPVHILVNSAGILANTTLCDGNVEKWRNTFEINVLGLCTATREAVSSMIKNNIAGHIIHMNSYSGHRPIEFVGENVYSASKYAVTALSHSWRTELIKKGTKIKVTSISPGLVVGTEIFEASGSQLATMDFGETIQPKDVSEAVLFALGTPPHVEIHEMMIRTAGSTL